MFGERYLATRERLSDVMRGIASLAAETGTDLGDRLSLSEIENGLDSPFLFVVCGEINAGKSTLINGLFGHPLCRVNVVPETDRALCYRYGNPPRDTDLNPSVRECYRPIPFLRDFHIIDTPGTNSPDENHRDAIRAFFPAADLIFFLFPVSNPWGSSTWNLISDLPASARERTVFVIQQADQREAKDLEVITGHVADLAMKRIGQVPPIFAVSAKLACEAKSTQPISRDRLRASGFPALEDFISQNVCHSPARRKVLDTWRYQSASALRAVEDRIEDQTRAINSHGRFVEEIEREIHGIRETFVKRLPSHLFAVAEVFQTEAVGVTKLLRRRLRALPSIARLFTGDRTGQEMETAFIARLQSAIEAVAETDGTEVSEACRSHWAELGERVKATMGVDLAATEPIDHTLDDARTRFVQRLGCAARAGIGDLKVRNQLDKELRRRNLALKSFTVTSLIFVIAGSTCGALDLPWLPGIFCGLAFVFFAGGVMTAWTTRKTITQEFQQRLLDTCDSFASTLYNDYSEALRLVFKDYAAALGSVRTHLAHEKLAIEPRLKRWQELFLTLKAIEQEL